MKITASNIVEELKVKTPATPTESAEGKPDATIRVERSTALDSEDLVPVVDDSRGDSLGDDESEEQELEEIEALVGTNLDGRYLIGKELARGGMGVVFRAQHLTLNREVVIKVLKAATVGSSSAKARFEREARRACQLDHPNIVTVHDFGYHDDLGYLVMEFVDGVTVDDYIRQYGSMSFVQFAPVIAAVCSGLAEAHRQGIVHRDIKCSNIMMTFEGERLRRVKILDFGLAKAEGAKEDNVTRQSTLVGTMGAMPPERILCKPSDCRVDLYALGIMAYRMIAGRRPFVGDDMHVLYQHVHELPPPLTEFLPEDHDYPIHVLEWVHRLLAKEPDDRPRDAGQAREWLLETVNDKGVFRIDEGDVRWKMAGVRGPLSGQWETSDPSWSITSAPSGSYRSVISGTSTARVVAELRAEAATSAVAQQMTVEIEPDAQSAAEGSSKGKFVLGILGAVVFAGVVVVSVLAAIPKDTSESGISDDPVAQPVKNDVAPPTRDNMEAVFTEIEAQLNKGAFATAENLLSSVSGQITDTNQRVRAAEFQSRIDIDKNLRKAKQAQDAMSIEEAMASYDAVLSLDANNEIAKQNHAELSKKVVLKVTSDPDQAEVFVDGKAVGTTPIREWVDAEFARVEIKKSGFQTWSTSLVPKGGTTVSLSAELDEPGHKTSRPNPTTKSDKKPDKTTTGGIKNEDLIDM